MADSLRIRCIVEGHGEIEAVPALIHKICHEHGLAPPVIPRPMRCDRHKLIKPGETERAVQLAVKSPSPLSGVLILADADDDCAAKVGPQLLHRALQVAGAVPVAVSLACREFESWFLAAAECFRGFHGLPVDLGPPPHAEEIRGAKEWLRKSATTGGNYRPSIDQLRFTRRLDLELARRSQSFRRFEREVLKLVTLQAP